METTIYPSKRSNQFYVLGPDQTIRPVIITPNPMVTIPNNVQQVGMPVNNTQNNVVNEQAKDTTATQPSNNTSTEPINVVYGDNILGFNGQNNNTTGIPNTNNGNSSYVNIQGMETFKLLSKPL
eukprot:gnl/Chilomastix_caulleri/2698.p1 GENE.gnl/Chilomastix_caulleri/2698~~gnl/Chilomastix_caulleri/2698.p1  ORF type:complete len:124 (+),score=21.04 gnl/Chilomastix_caulleri/2698:29-400(+)